jgi:hypothetical protein
MGKGAGSNNKPRQQTEGDMEQRYVPFSSLHFAFITLFNEEKSLMQAEF